MPELSRSETTAQFGRSAILAMARQLEADPLRGSGWDEVAEDLARQPMQLEQQRLEIVLPEADEPDSAQSDRHVH